MLLWATLLWWLTSHVIVVCIHRWRDNKWRISKIVPWWVARQGFLWNLQWVLCLLIPKSNIDKPITITIIITTAVNFRLSTMIWLMTLMLDSFVEKGDLCWYTVVWSWFAVHGCLKRLCIRSHGVTHRRCFVTLHTTCTLRVGVATINDSFIIRVSTIVNAAGVDNIVALSCSG